MSTFVLVHGAGTGGWLWSDVADRLTTAGHTVHAPSLIGVGERVSEGGPATDITTHIQQVAAVFRTYQLSDVVLVGFSYGGFVITGVADAVPHLVGRLVYLDAFVPKDGKCFLDLLPTQFADMMVNAATSVGDGWRIPPAPIETLGGIGTLEPDVDPGHVQAVLARRGPHPIGTYREVMHSPFSRSSEIPRKYLSCTEKPPHDPLLAQAAALGEAGWVVQELPAGHFAMLSKPTTVTGAIQ